MAIQLLGNGGVIIGAGEEARKAMHIQNMPMTGNWYRYSGFTGTIGAALAANSELLQFRFVAGTKTYALVHHVRLDGIGIVAVATALGPLGWCIMPARAWTVAGSGGTRIANTGDNLQTETALPNSQVTDLGIATTAALTVGTKTLDANCAGQDIIAVGTGAATTFQMMSLGSDLFNASNEGGQPLVLANQEGFVIRTTHIGPAALTYTIGFTVVWCEVTAY